MIIFREPKDIEAVLQISADLSEECFKSLEHCLRHLQRIFGGHPKVHIEMGRDMFEREGFVRNFVWGCIRVRSGECTYNGGLNFSRTSETWSLNS